jgi:hypothetical protein
LERSLPIETTLPVSWSATLVRKLRPPFVEDFVHTDAVEPVESGVVDVFDHDPDDYRVDRPPRAAQQPGDARLVHSLRQHAATFSKSVVCRALGRAHHSCSVRTRQQNRQSMRWMSASRQTWQAPKSRCRYRRRGHSHRTPVCGDVQSIGKHVTGVDHLVHVLGGHLRPA